jgi:hypothetical protein
VGRARRVVGGGPVWQEAVAQWARLVVGVRAASLA